MQIWVDADACPGAIKDILYRAAERCELMLTLVANRPLHAPRSQFIRTVQVGGGFDVADRHIAEAVCAGDLVVTADVPLAAAVVERGGLALNPRGTLYDEESIGEAVAVRNLASDLRDAGVATGGPPPLGKKDRQTFANTLDRLLTRRT